jgi:undecaprenyl-diphosphatase
VGLTRPAAARFSFLLSTPILLAAISKQAIDVIQKGITPGEAVVFGAGMAAAAVSGYLSIRLLLGFLRTRSLWPFVVYRVIAGSVVLALVATGRL